MNLIHEYKNFFDRKLIDSDGSLDTIEFWRNRLFSYLMMVIAPFGLIAYVPSMFMAITTEAYAIAIVDTLAMFYVVFIIFNNSIKIKTKKLLFFAVMYLMSAVLLLYLGQYGPGLLFLLMISILYLLMVNSKAAFRSIAINFFFSMIPLLGLYFNLFVSEIDEGYSLGTILTFNANFWLVNITCVVGISIIINGLNKKIEIENNLTKELKRQNEALEEAKKKAEQSDKLKTAFLANMSHEIRTPLNSITGFSSMLIDENLQRDEVQEYSRIVHSNSKKLLDIISDIIEISKLESNNVNIQNKSFEIDALIKDIYNTNKYLENEEIIFKYSIDIDTKINFVIGDVAKIKQIMTNFVVNAFKYTQDGFVQLGVKFINNRYYFYVKDSGIGIKDEISDKIFDRFFQTDDFYDGTGLGLAICKSLAKILNGEITVKSEIGVGSEFGFTLDLRQDPNIDDNNNKKELKDNIKVLIAEDQHDNYMLLKTVLKKLNIDSKRAINGIEVVEMAKEEYFDIIFMDIKMPFMNGIEALKQIREFNKDVKIFAITAYAFDSDRDGLINEGFDEYISKPVDLDELRMKIKALI